MALAVSLWAKMTNFVFCVIRKIESEEVSSISETPVVRRGERCLAEGKAGEQGTRKGEMMVIGWGRRP